MIEWLSCIELSHLSGISRQKAHRALIRAIELEPKTWRGSHLVVRAVRGAGGRSGIHYEVRVDSLPTDLQQRWRELQTPFETRLSHGSKAQIDREWWYELIAPALAFPKHSRDRGEAIREIVGKRHMRPDGSWISVGERSVQRRLDAFDGSALAGLSRLKRIDAGEARVSVSQAWDRAVPFDDRAKHQIANQLRQYVRGLIAKGEAGKILGMLAEKRLRELTSAAGFEPGAEALEAACRVPENFLIAEKRFKKVHELNTDRKAFEDKRPRIVRTRDGLAPMSIVVADIHPIDILAFRADGSTATPRAIAWLDIATNRVWVDVVLLGKGEGVRNAHVILSFINMVRAWGAPAALYLDNGSEYNWAEFVDDALKLINREGARLIPVVDKLDERRSQIVRARPYNAAAKPIEGIFAVLEKTYLSAIPGWIGGDRMRKKTANVGKEAEPFPGTFDELRVLIVDALNLYHKVPQAKRGALKGRSPDGAFGRAVEAGWSRTEIEADTLRVAFSTEKRIAVRQGAIQHAGRRWTCEELQAFAGDKIRVLIPKFEEWARLPLLDDRGGLLGFATRDAGYGFLDAEGAREAARRANRHHESVRQLERSVPAIDRQTERRALAAEIPTPPAAPVGASLTATPDAAKILARLRETPEEQREREWRERDERAAASVAMMEDTARRMGLLG